MAGWITKVGCFGLRGRVRIGGRMGVRGEWDGCGSAFGFDATVGHCAGSGCDPILFETAWFVEGNDIKKRV